MLSGILWARRKGARENTGRVLNRDKDQEKTLRLPADPHHFGGGVGEERVGEASRGNNSRHAGAGPQRLLVLKQKDWAARARAVPRRGGLRIF